MSFDGKSQNLLVRRIVSQEENQIYMQLSGYELIALINGFF